MEPYILKIQNNALRALYKWGYDPILAMKHSENATPQQIAYIENLAQKNRNLAFEIECLLNEFDPSGGHALIACNKGQAMFVIAVLTGQIKPKKYVMPDDWCNDRVYGE